MAVAATRKAIHSAASSTAATNCGDGRRRAGQSRADDEHDGAGAARPGRAGTRRAPRPRRPRREVWRRSAVRPLEAAAGRSRRIAFPAACRASCHEMRRARRCADSGSWSGSRSPTGCTSPPSSAAASSCGSAGSSPTTRRRRRRSPTSLDHGPAVLGAVAAARRSPSACAAAATAARSRSRRPTCATSCWPRCPARQVLARPVVQRLRSMAFAGALVGGIAGQLAARRLPGLRRGVGGQRGLAGAAIGRAVRRRRRARPRRCTCPAGWRPGSPCVVLAAQGCADRRPDPRTGRPHRQRRPVGHAAGTPSTSSASPSSSCSAVVAVVAGRGLRVEPLVRRGDLVSQLRFAVTMQDLRTVVLLRRQLRGEQPRDPPWFGLRPTLTAARRQRAIWQRGLAGPAALPGGPPGAHGRPRRRRRHRRRSPCCGGRRRPSSASAAPCTCSAWTPSSRCRRRSTTPTTPTPCRRPRAG